VQEKSYFDVVFGPFPPPKPLRKRMHGSGGGGWTKSYYIKKPGIIPFHFSMVLFFNGCTYLDPLKECVLQNKEDTGI
jgi:hypothetical protein